MTREELTKYIQDESKGEFKSIEDLKESVTESGKRFRHQVRKVLKRNRRKDLETANSLSFNERFYKKSEEDKRIVDSITGSEYSFERMSKKAILKTLVKPSGRQLRKEKRFLRNQLKQNDNAEETR